MALEVRRRRSGSGDRAVEVIDVIGRLDTPGAAMLRSKVQEALKEGSSRIGINLSECVEIHRETIGTFHSLGRACNRTEGRLVLFGMKGDVAEYVRRFADKDLAQWYDIERDAIIALGGEVAPEIEEEGEKETPAVVALGKDQIFRGIFWKLNVLGGRPVAKFDNIEGAEDFLGRRSVHSLLIDTHIPMHEITQLVRKVRTNPKLKFAGIFPVGPPSHISTGRLLVEEGADIFVPLSFSGEEIAAMLDPQTFFARLKDVYERFDARADARKSDTETS